MDRFVISIDNKAIIVWNILIIFLQVFTSYMYMYFAAFRLRKRDNEDDHWALTYHITIGIELIFLIELILNFFKE